MSQKGRIITGIALLVVLVAVVLGLEFFRGQSSTLLAAGEVTLTPGNVPIYLDGELVAGFAPAALEGLEQASFVDAAEGKVQDGWLLRDILLIYLPEDSLQRDSKISITSSSRGKAAELTWSEVSAPENMVMFDLSNRGTLKLVSLLERLDDREEWVQDADRIEVTSP
jgi:hypothetical protein